MFELLRMPEAWFASAAVVGACTAGVVCNLFATYVFSRYPIVEDEPAIDLDLLEAELRMDRAVLEYRLANERRAEMIAGSVK